VNITYGKYDFSGIESRSGFLKLALLSKVKEQLTSSTVIQYKVQLFLRLKGHVHADNERMLNISKHTSFSLCVLDLIPLDNVVFFEDLKSVHGVGFQLVNKKHFA
jgi:hypothetical protein